MGRLIWLSFADDSGFKGVAIVEIDDTDIAEADALVATMGYSTPDPEVGVICAAARKAHKLGCNPGGEVCGIDVNDRIPSDLIGRLISREELIERGLATITGEE